jgi:tetratricopeptide (TPR) repeat protein
LQRVMLDLGPLELAEPVIELETAQMLRGTALSHDLLGEALLKELPEVIKVHLHKRAASYLATFDDRNAQAAEHWLEAGEMVKAIEQWQKAAQTLYERGLPHEAVQLLERVLGYTEYEMDSLKTKVQLARLYNEVARYDEAKTLIETVIPKLDEPRLRAEALYVQGDLLCNEGNLSEAASVIEEGSKLAKYLRDKELLGDFWGLEEFLAYSEGRYQDAINLATRQLNYYRNGPPSARLALVLSNIGTYHRCLGQLEDAILYQQEARHIAKNVGATQQEFSALANLAGVYHFMGKLEEALHLNTEALALGDFYGRDFVRGNQATQLLRLGRYAEAIAVSETLAREANQIEARILSWTRLAELYTLTGQQTKVSAVLDEAIYLAKQTELTMVRARVVIDAYKFGSETHRAEVGEILEHLDVDTVPHDMREELEALFPK